MGGTKVGQYRGVCGGRIRKNEFPHPAPHRLSPSYSENKDTTVRPIPLVFFSAM